MIHLRSLCLPVLTLAVGLAGCRQEVVASACGDGHVDVDATADASPPGDAGSPDTQGADTGTSDAGLADAAPRCEPFCLRGVTVSADVVDVKEAVTLTPVLDTSGSGPREVTAPTWRAERGTGRPALVPAELNVSVSASATQVTFVVQEVPPWFFETTFVVTVQVRDVGSGFTDTVEASVKVRGNVLLSGGADGKVYAVASDGRPAGGIGGRFADGALLEQLVVTPRSLQLLPDGTLLVHDEGATPPRIGRFELTGKDVSLADLQYRDGQGMAVFSNEQNAAYGLALLPDGRAVYPEHHFAGVSNEPKSRLMVWRADGTFERSVWAPSSEEEWRGATTTPDGKVVVADRGLDVITRYDPATWLPDGTLVDRLPGIVYAVEPTAQALYVTGYQFIWEVGWAAGRAAITDLPGAASAWRGITAYEGGRLLAIRDTQDTATNVVLIEGRRFVRYFRVASAGPVMSPSAIEYLR
jgi:hypothetical protein